MKIDIKSGVVVATAETRDDIETLLGLGEAKTTGKNVKRRKYKRQMTRTCSICGSTHKGAVGLGIHLAKVHGVRSGQPLPVTV